MAGLGTPATTSIITGGLDCTPACIGMITSHFSLYCTEVPPDPDADGGGGPYPANSGAWNQIQDIGDFYKPVPEQPFVVPLDQEADYFRRKKQVVLKFKIADIEVEKIYMIPESRKKGIVTVFNLIDVTRQRISATAGNVKRIASRAVVAIKNLRVKKRK